MPAELTSGSTFAGYRIEGLVGRGGMGVVYRATDLSLERPVALKLIAPELAEDERFRGRFLRESRLAASLDHGNVIPIYEAGEEDGQLFIAMRYVEGSDLKELLEQEGTLGPERALSICAQVAGALDAAHAKGLVHRDVKPGNVLLDERGHAYLTDFGLTKQLGGASTQTGQIVGTLDYLAPEQIRGEELDGRSDQYALACLLYECLAGSPPFHRETEAEVLWGHMQEEPPSLRDHPALDPVLRRGLAKDRAERYPTCSDLLDSARESLGLETPRARRRRRLMRRSRILLAAGAVIFAGAIAALIAILITGGDSQLVAPGNAVAAIDAGGRRVAAYTEVGTTPSNVAVGEGSVWVVNGDDKTVSRIDSDTKRIVKTFGTGGVPTDLAVGEGAVWVGNGASTPGFLYTASVSRIDPGSSAVTRTLELPGGQTPVLATAPGVVRLAAGADALWAINPDGSVSRIDPRTGDLVAKIAAEDAGAIAAGEGGVWVLEGAASVARIDSRSNRVGQRIAVGATFLGGIAVGGGSVWATSPLEGVVWRIDPGPSPVTRTIDVGFGVDDITFGEGAVWATNFLDDTVARIDPRTSRVTARIAVAGTPGGVAVGNGWAWVSVAGGPRGGSLPASACRQVISGGREPDVLIASDLPLQGSQGVAARAIADAVRFVVQRHGFKAGKYAVGYQSCDDSTAQTGTFDFSRCTSNAKAYAQAAQLVAVIGPYNSPCASVEIPILNRASGGPVAMVSPSNTHPGLTRRSPANNRGEPQQYYPAGIRNYLRVAVTDDLQGAAHPLLAKRLGLRSVYLLSDRSAATGQYGRTLTTGFRRAARQVGVRIAGTGTFDPAAKSHAALAEKVARSGADGVFVGGLFFLGGDRVVRSLRARLGTRVVIMVPETFLPAEMLKAVGSDALGIYVSVPGTPLQGLGPAGRTFLREFRKTQPGGRVPAYVAESAQAAEIVLAAITRSDGTRASVLRELRRSRVRNGILGSFRFDRNGDITPGPVTMYRITGKTPPGADVFSDFRGAVVDRVVRVPVRLLR